MNSGWSAPVGTEPRVERPVSAFRLVPPPPTRVSENAAPITAPACGALPIQSGAPAGATLLEQRRASRRVIPRRPTVGDTSTGWGWDRDRSAALGARRRGRRVPFGGLGEQPSPKVDASRRAGTALADAPRPPVRVSGADAAEDGGSRRAKTRVEEPVQSTTATARRGFLCRASLAGHR